MRFIEAQILERQGHLLRCHAEIVSGAYKLRKTQCGTRAYPELGSAVIAWRDLTDDEKLESAMSELRSHARLLSELVEYLGSNPNEKRTTAGGEG